MEQAYFIKPFIVIALIWMIWRKVMRWYVVHRITWAGEPIDTPEKRRALGELLMIQWLRKPWVANIDRLLLQSATLCLFLAGIEAGLDIYNHFK
jgi:hypothetical protein